MKLGFINFLKCINKVLKTFKHCFLFNNLNFFFIIRQMPSKFDFWIEQFHLILFNNCKCFQHSKMLIKQSSKRDTYNTRHSIQNSQYIVIFVQFVTNFHVCLYLRFVRSMTSMRVSLNPIIPTGAFNICCPRDCVSASLVSLRA